MAKLFLAILNIKRDASNMSVNQKIFCKFILKMIGVYNIIVIKDKLDKN